MKKSLVLFAIILAVLSPCIDLSGQVETIEIGISYPRTNSYDIGKNGIVIIATSNGLNVDNSSIDVIRLDTTGKLVWDKKVKIGDTKYTQHFCVTSADGNDIYVLSLIEIWPKGGGKGIILTHFNAETGAYTQKKNDEQTFGHILTMYANKDYMFVLTSFSQYRYYNNDNKDNDEKTGKLSLYRFKKNTLEMEKIPDHKMSIGSQGNNIFWQPIRVGEDFVESYIVKSVDEKIISLLLARFDNDGQIISSTTAEITLLENYPRVSNSTMPMGPGISRSNIFPNVNNLTMQLMSWCYLTYEPVSGHYYAYGICGSQKQKNGFTVNSGFYVAEFDKDFKVLALKENSKLSLLTKNARFDINAAVDQRYIDGFITSKNQLMIHLAVDEDNFFYPVSTQTLACGEGIQMNIKSKIFYGGFISALPMIFPGNYMAAPEKLLLNERTEEKKLEDLCYIATNRRQYLMFRKKDKMVVYTEKMK